MFIGNIHGVWMVTWTTGILTVDIKNINKRY